jgi:signal transduction histidine kinase
MNSALIPEFSLFQIIQSLAPPQQTLTVRMSCFKALARAWVELLEEQQIKATIWAKLPQNSDALAAIAQYEQSGRLEQLYLCQIGETTAKPASSTHSSPQPTRITPIFLEASAQLRREFFLLVLSRQFCGLLVAQQETQDAPPTSQNQPFCAKIAYSFAPTAIEAALRGIQQAIALNDTTPAEIFADSPIPFPLPAFPEAKLLDCLLGKQIEVSESAELASIEAAKHQLPDFPSPEFLKNLARELNTVLTSQKTALQLLESTQNKREQRHRYLQFVQQECNLQNSLVAGLQELVEINESAASLQLSPKLEDLIPAIVSTYQPLATERGITLGYTVPAELPLVICAGNWLQRILQHLLNNSLKFTPAKGQIQVRAAQKQEWVELTVTDTGVGIGHSDLPHIFTSFYRGRNANSEGASGAGLGLTAARQMVQLCGGEIEIASQPAKGTVVTIRFPIAS